MTGPQTITAAAAARRLGVNKSTVTRWITAGKVPAVRQGSRWRVRMTWVDAELARIGRMDTVSAVEEYRKERARLAEVCGAGTPEDLANDAIAEMDAERDRLRDRRCDGCAKYKKPQCPVSFMNPTDEMRGYGAFNYPDDDFACNRWDARGAPE